MAFFFLFFLSELIYTPTAQRAELFFFQKTSLKRKTDDKKDVTLRPKNEKKNGFYLFNFTHSEATLIISY